MWKDKNNGFPLHTVGEAVVFPNVILQLSALLSGKEPQRSGCAEHLARMQHCAWEIGETGRTGKVLGFQRKASIFLRLCAILQRCFYIAVEVGGI